MYTVIIYDITGKYNKYITHQRPTIEDGLLNVYYEPTKNLVYNLSNVISFKITEVKNED